MFPRTGDVWPDGEAEPSRFFATPDRSRKGNWKAMQLCKQVERAVTVALAGECESAVLVGATVAAVEPAPDAGRLRVSIVLAPGMDADGLAEGRAALARSQAAIREEVARWIHRKRVPEIVFEVRLGQEARHE
jgi:hypothetical protein